MILPLPIINGKQFSWSSIELQVNGLLIPGVKAINYKDSLTPGKPRGSGSTWIGHTTGQYEADADIEIYRLWHEAYKLSLGGVNFMTLQHIITVSMFDPEIGVVTDTLVVRVMGNETSGSDTPDATTVKHPLSVLQPILWNNIPGIIPGF